MKVKIFTLHPDGMTGDFDDAAVREFLDSRHLISCSDHFCQYNNQLVLLLVITYCDEYVLAPLNGNGQKKTNPRDELDDSAVAVYDALRTWRNSKAEALGVSNFVLFSNRQLAGIARLGPRSLSELGSLPGVGAARLKDHGAEILNIISGFCELDSVVTGDNTDE